MSNIDLDLIKLMYIYLPIVCTVVEPLYIDHSGKVVCFGGIGMSVYLLPRFYERVAMIFYGGVLCGKRNK